MKIKGKFKIPDYIQLRNENYILVAYFRADRQPKGLEKFGWGDKEAEFQQLVENLPFGILQEINL